MAASTSSHEFADLQNRTELEVSEIQQYFSGTTIFITGATGFLGKVLVEKLLRACYDLKKIYILVRSKKDKSPERRFEEYFNDPLYDRLKSEQPNSLQKLYIISGDCERPNLGMTEKDIQLIISEVNCIFHLAATVRFDEKLRITAYINVRAAKDILSIAKKMRNLKSLIHVSTAYSFCPRQTIDEVVYQPGMTAEDLLTIVDAVDEEQLTNMTPILLKEWPNTYVFTKAVAEDLIKRESANLPVAIVRPSIVMSTAKDPVPGWVDNYYGITGLSTAICLGFMRTMSYAADCVSDQVPADYVVSNTIAAAWDVGSRRKTISIKEKLESQDIQIYNYVSGTQNPLFWEQCNIYGRKHVKDCPSMYINWHYFLIPTPNRLTFLFLHYILHLFPAYILDFLMIALGKKRRLVKTYNRIKESVLILRYFTTKTWNFKNETTQVLWKKMGNRDRELFDFDITSYDWDSFYKSFIYGARVYLLKDPIETLPQAESKALKLKIAHYTLVLSLVSILLTFSLILVNMVIGMLF